jgi:type IV secretory pathway TrbD component
MNDDKLIVSNYRPIHKRLSEPILAMGATGGIAAVSVIGDAQGMGFDWRLTESTRRSIG